MNEDLQRFLLEASRELAATLDYQDTLRRVARLLVPRLCDGCSVYISEDGREAERVAVANVDPVKEALAHDLPSRHQFTTEALYGVGRVLRSGHSEMVPAITDAFLVRVAADRHHLAVLRGLKMRSSMIVPLRVRDRVVGALSMATDVSGRHFGPDELAFAEDFALRTAVAVENSLLYREARAAVARAEDEARQRERLIAALERSNGELDQFASVASHDLKAPLRGIATVAGWIEEDLGAALTPELRGHLALLNSRVRQMEALVGGILSYARAGRQEGGVEPVDTGALAAEVVALLVPAPGARVDVDPGMPALNTARAPLQQVLLNLVGNALKHAAGPATRVRVGALETDAGWEFFVADNGPGIAPQYHARIWEMFQRLRPKDEVEGTGIGLAVVRKIVESMGGRAWVESEEGEGACFRFTWPDGVDRGA